MEIDACAALPCDAHAECTKTGPGSNKCTCLPGYHGDGEECEEIDGCASNPCHVSANCTKSGPGTYICDCFFGFVGDGIDCRPSQSSNALTPMSGPMYSEHKEQIIALQKHLSELELTQGKQTNKRQQKEIEEVRDTIANLEKVTSKLINSTENTHKTLQELLKQRQNQNKNVMLETNNESRKNRIRIKD